MTDEPHGTRSNTMEMNSSAGAGLPSESEGYDYSFVNTVSNIAVYDDALSGPRVIKIQPSDTGAYIEALASTIYQSSQELGGSISYTIIREVSENFIHAQFKEVLVTVRDGGNTIIFADHGPGIPCKDKAQMPGFSSAVEPMRNYIRGVGSGLPIVREYLEMSRGTITIEDNLGTGAVVTISVAGDDGEDALNEMAAQSYAGGAPAYGMAAPEAAPQAIAMPQGAQPIPLQQSPYQGHVIASPTPAQPYAAPGAVYGGMPVVVQTSYPAAQIGGSYLAAAPGQPAYEVVGGQPPIPGASAAHLSSTQTRFLQTLLVEGPLGNKDVAAALSITASNTTNNFNKLKQLGYVQKYDGKYVLTPLGQQVAQTIR